LDGLNRRIGELKVHIFPYLGYIGGNVEKLAEYFKRRPTRDLGFGAIWELKELKGGYFPQILEVEIQESYGKKSS